ncbi:LuxR C-terminal-related transcriptional regulator [Xanthobacter variabilis]
MHTGIEKSQGRLCLMLIDDLPLRRASIRRLLEDWAGEDELQLDTIEPENSQIEIVETDTQLIVFNIGGASLSSPGLRTRVEALRQDLPRVPLVIICDNDEVSEVVEVLKAGASGFICSRIAPAVVFQALRFIMGGGVYFPANALLRANEADRSDDWSRSRGGKDASYCSNLTARQNSVLRLLQKGYSNKHIARELAMCESTVKVHVRQIMRKLGASNRTQAALCGIEQGTASEAAPRTSLAAETVSSPLLL